MLQAPPAKDYETGLGYWPYKLSLKRVEEIVQLLAERKGKLLDLMCGPGYLLGRINSQRSDLSLHGVDLDSGNIHLAQKKYPAINFELADVLEWNSDEQFDAVLCTGALHHLPYEKQESLMKKMFDLTKSGGFGMLADCYIDNYSNETERKLAAAKLGYEYLVETIKNGAPPEVIEDTADILRNDVVMAEFKDSLEKRLPTFERVFGKFKIKKIWPNDEIGGYGDYVTFYRKD